MKEKFIKKLASIGLFAVLGLAACGGNGSNSGKDDDQGGDKATTTNVTVNPVEHASALVTFGSFNMDTFTWSYSIDPVVSITNYTLTDNDETLVIVLSVDEGYDVTAVSVNDDEVTSYMKGDAKALYPVSENGDYVVTLTVQEKPAYDSTVTHVETYGVGINYVVYDADWNEYADIEYYDENDFSEVGHISFPYSQPTIVDITVVVFDPNYELDKVLVNGIEATQFENPMLGQIYYEYEFPCAGDYVVTVTLTEVAA